MSLSPNTRLGPYEILAPLGAGGMGEVYRARDTRLDRDVAIKVLPDRTARDENALSRFRRETKALAALSHPNILMILDVGEDHGVSYAVMELLDGGTLRDRLRAVGIDWRKALEIGAGVADGLAAAHARGIVHRDLKPENLFLTRDGVVKILDFGLARTGLPDASDRAAVTVTVETQPGVVLGTVNYMSPEQVRGQQADARCDIFSLGCVLHEMLTGKPPFARETSAETMTAILRHHPTLPSESGAHVPPDVDPVVAKCLEKSPEERFHSAHDLAFTLRSILTGRPATSVGKRPRLPWPAIVVMVAAALLVGVFLLRRELRPAGREITEMIDSLAVLPLENVARDPEQEYFVDGMTEALISDLAKIGSLKVISRTSVMRYRGTTKSLPEIAKELKVDAVVEGSVLRVGERVRITAQLIHAATDEHLWADRYDRDLSDVLRLHSELARTIAQEIKVTLTPQERARMVDARTINPAAHEAYLKGRFHCDKRTPDGIKKAVDYFEQAVALAPDWPLGHAGLADTYLLMPFWAPVRSSEAIPKARAAAERALEMDESLAEAHATMGHIATTYDWDWPTAEREYQRALTLSPNYAVAHFWYTMYLLFMGRHDKAIREITKAQELDPLSLIIGTNVGRVHYFAGDLEHAETWLRRTLELGPDYAPAHRGLGITLLLQGRFAEAITEAREAVRLSNNDPYHAAILGYLYAKGGQPEEAQRILDELAVRSKLTYVAPTQFALVHEGLVERDRVFEWLERAYQERDAWMLYTLTDPLLAPLRSDPRFADLVRRVGLPSPPVARGTAPPSSPLSKRGDGNASPLNKGGNRGVVGGKIMLAVLPFENLSRDPEQDYFSDGLTEEMITQLGRLNPAKLGVIARSSAMHYKNADRAIDRVRQELGVDYVVEGSVRRAENRVRISAKLIHCTDQSQLWANSFERELKDILALQNDVAQAVAQEIRVTLTPQEQARIVEARPVHPEAHQAYLKGRFHWNKRTPDGLLNAVKQFDLAISLAPDWPLGYAGLADAYSLMPWYGPVRPSEAMPKAKEAVAKALEMDESLAEAHTSRGWIAATYDWDWPVAEREYERAIALSPNYATAHHWYAVYFRNMSRHEEAIREITKAQELDPLSLIIGVNVGLQHYYVGDFAQAETCLRKTLELGPDFARTHRDLARTLLLQGKLAEAITEAREAVRLSKDDPWFVAILGYVCAKTGQPEEARRILDEFAARSKEAYVAPTHFAWVYAGLDERDRMFEWLEKAYQERDLLLLSTLPDPLLAPMRSDARFADLVRRVGLPAVGE
jgi:serine/threonine-protein kinase